MSSVPTNYEGPVCQIINKTNVVQPTAQSLPQIPFAEANLQSLANAVNIIRQQLLSILGPPNAPNNTGGAGGGGSSPQQAFGDFTEVPGTRATKTVRIYNPSDKSQYVDVEQITGVKFQNKAGNTLQWNLGS